MKTRVVHVAENVEGAVYVGRAVPRRGLKASKWANPYRIGHDGTRGETIARYWHDLVFGRLAHLQQELPALRGKPLACWCRHSGAAWVSDEQNGCHADVLVDLLERYTDDELRQVVRGRGADD